MNTNTTNTNLDMTTILSTVVAQAVSQAMAPINARLDALEANNRTQPQPQTDLMSALLTALAQPAKTEEHKKPAKAKDLNITWSATKNFVEYAHEDPKHYWTKSERRAVNLYIKSAGGAWQKSVDGKGGHWTFATNKAAKDFVEKAPKCVTAEEVKAQQDIFAEKYNK